MPHTALLLKGDGANNSTNIVDSSLYPKSVTVYGNTKISTTTYPYESSSLYFDGAGDYLKVDSNSIFNLNTVFTIECWINYSNNSTGMICGIWDVYPNISYIIFSYSGGIGFSYSTSGYWQAANDLLVTGSFQNQWLHVALCRLSTGDFLLFINGVMNILRGSNSDVIYYGSNPTLKVGGNTNNQWFNGYIKDLRITYGVALYTSNFTPPTNLTLESYDVINNILYSPSYFVADTIYQPETYLLSSNKSVLDLIYGVEFSNGVYSKADFVLIEGYVTVDSVPTSRQVWLFEWYNKKVVRTTWSDQVTGYYKFDDIKAGSYFVWSEDYQNVYRPQSTMEITEGTYNLNFSSVSGSYNQYIEDPFDSSLTLFSGIAKYNNNSPVASVSLLSESGTFITSVVPDSITGAYSFYVKKGNKYVIVFVGNGIYRPEAYLYQAPN